MKKINCLKIMLLEYIKLIISNNMRFLNILKEIKTIVKNLGGYLTVIKVNESLKVSIDIFTIDDVKYKISEKIKKSFDPKRILNPGKMYTGI